MMLLFILSIFSFFRVRVRTRLKTKTTDCHNHPNSSMLLATFYSQVVPWHVSCDLSGQETVSDINAFSFLHPSYIVCLDLPKLHED